MTTTTEIATHPGPGFTYFGRWLGRCPSCKGVVKVELAADQAKAGWYAAGRRSASCLCTEKGTAVVVKMVLGSTSDKTCGSTCRNAKGPSCDCSCGGKNHGGG